MSPVTTGDTATKAIAKNLQRSANFQLPHILFFFFPLVSNHGRASGFFWRGNKYQETALPLLFAFSFHSEVTARWLGCFQWDASAGRSQWGSI